MDSLITLLSIIALWNRGITHSSIRSEIKTHLNEGLDFAKEHKIKYNSLKKLLHAISLKKAYADDQDTYNELIATLTDSLKNAIPKLASVKYNFSDIQIALLKDLRLYINNDSEPAWQRIKKHIVKINKDISKWFFKGQKKATSKSQTKPMERLQELVYFFTKRKNDIDMDVKERAKAKLKNEELYKEFLSIRRSFTTDFQQELTRYVRETGKRLVLISKARKHFDELGIYYRIPKGLKDTVKYMDEEGFFYTSAKRKIRGRPNPEATIKLNENYDPIKDDTYIFSAKAPVEKDWHLYYTEKLWNSRQKAKFKKVTHVVENIDTFREKWLKDLFSKNEYRQVLAAMTEIMYQTQARIGSAGNKSDGKPTYGLSTWQIKHVKYSPDKITFTYSAKKGVKQKHVLKQNGSREDVKLFKIIERLIKGKSNSDNLFTYDDGKKLTASDVNFYLKKVTGNKDITAHKFRHAKGTTIAIDLLINKRPKNLATKSLKDINDYFKKVATEVGKELGHISGEKVTPNTAINNYIEPDVMKQYFVELGVRVPPIIQKLIRD